jgi:hypothetical protein
MISLMMIVKTPFSQEGNPGSGNGNNARMWAHFVRGSTTTVDSVIIGFSYGTKVKKINIAAN